MTKEKSAPKSETKKKPVKSLKEKRADKRGKKETAPLIPKA